MKQLKYRLLSVLMATLALLFGGFVAVAAAGGGSGSNAMATGLVVSDIEPGQISATTHEAGVIMSSNATADLDHGGILAQGDGDGNGFWGQLRARADIEGAALANDSSIEIYGNEIINAVYSGNPVKSVNNNGHIGKDGPAFI